MPDAVGLLPGLAQTVVYISLIIVLAGLVSGIVAVGIMQIFGRAVVQRRVLARFFLFRVRYPSGELRGPWDQRGASYAADILGMPEPLLCALYYRQITGQLLAAANAEAVLGRSDLPYRPDQLTPILDALTPFLGDESYSKEEPAARLQAASRTIDILQAELGDAGARTVSLFLMLIWTLVYLVAGTFAVLGSTIVQAPEGFFARVVVLISAVGLFLIAGLLAACSTAVGLTAFNWLERVSVPR